MACELVGGVISDIMVREAWQRNCGPEARQELGSWAAVLETASKAGGAAEVLRGHRPPSPVSLGDWIQEPCPCRYKNPWMLKSLIYDGVVFACNLRRCPRML